MARKIRRRGQKQFWRWVSYLTLYVILAGSMASLLVWGRNYLHTNPRFTIKEVTFSGCALSTAQELEERLAWVVGGNVFQCDLDQVRSVILDHRWVDQVVIRRNLPNGLNVEITQETPVGLVLLDQKVFVVSQSGTPICAVDAYDRELDVPVLIGLDAYEEPEEVIQKGLSLLTEIKQASLLFWGNLETLDLSDPENAVAQLTHDRAPVNLGEHLVADNLLNFLSIADYVQQRYPKLAYVELGFPGQVVVMPRQTENPN